MLLCEVCFGTLLLWCMYRALDCLVERNAYLEILKRKTMKNEKGGILILRNICKHFVRKHIMTELKNTIYIYTGKIFFSCGLVVTSINTVYMHAYLSVECLKT